MINNKRVLAIIPARGGSKGLPGKNIKEFYNKPLIAWSIKHGLDCDYIDTVLVSTDSKEIADIAKEYGAFVPFLRPNDLSNDSASTIDVLLHAINYLEKSGDVYEYIVLLEATSPLRDVGDISGAIEKLLANPESECIVGVTKAEASHPAFLFSVEGSLIKPITGQSPNGLRRQDLIEDYYYLEGSVYVSSVDALKEYKSFYHDKTAPWVVDRYKAIEIDELSDFIMAEALMKSKVEGILS